MLSPCRDRIYTPDTTGDTHMKNMYNSTSVSAGPAAPIASPILVLDSLIQPSFKELKEAHYRIAAETREAREHAGREFRAGQSGIPLYLPY